MKFKLVEELLLEKQWYLATFNTNSGKTQGYMYLPNKEEDAKTAAEKILSSTTQQACRDFVSKKHWDKVKDVIKGFDGTVSLSNPLTYSQIINDNRGIIRITDVDRDWRRQTHKEFENSDFGKMLDKEIQLKETTIHHFNENEADFSTENLAILPNGNDPHFGNAVHQILHKFNWGPESAGEGFNRTYEYNFYTAYLDPSDGSTKLQRHTISVK